MLAKLRPRSAYDVMAALSLFIVLGGASYAAATGSIDSREIKNNSVRSKDVRNNDIRTKDVRNRSLLAKDFKKGQLPAGPQGAAGATNVTVRTGQGTPTAQANCLAGERAVGGGGVANGEDDYLYLSAPFPPGGTPTGWRVGYDDPNNPTVGTVRAFVVCASP